MSFAVMPLLLATTQASAAEPLLVSGRYEFRTDAESMALLGQQVCFVPDALSAAHVPRASSDRRVVWFCFSNSDTAFKQFGIPATGVATSCGWAGTAQVTIDAYKVYRGEGDYHDTARLVSVVRRSEPVPLRCAP